MNQFVESLKRLFEDKKIDADTIKKLVVKGKIDEDERKYILGA